MSYYDKQLSVVAAGFEVEFVMDNKTFAFAVVDIELAFVVVDIVSAFVVVADMGTVVDIELAFVVVADMVIVVDMTWGSAFGA